MSLAVRSLTKRYGGVTVLDHVDLSVENGEIHALLGANGAGKSTLIKCVSGAVSPDEGEIDISGQSFRALSPKQARAAGVAVIYQELSVFDTLNVSDNMFMNEEISRFGWRRPHKQKVECREWLDNLGVDIDPSTSLGSLSVAKMQVVEIAKALRRSPQVLILDEPTSSLSEAEVKTLGSQMQALRAQGLPILFITHRMSEVFDWADRVSVLRAGQVVLSGPVADISRSQVISAITAVTAADAATAEDARRAAHSAGSGSETLLSVRGLLGPGYGPIDLDVGAHEILGVFGLVGSGRTELVESLFGAESVQQGTVEMTGHRVSTRSPRDAVAAGIALVPSDRRKKSLFLNLPAFDNILSASFVAVARRGLWRNKAAEGRMFDEGAAEINLQPPRRKLDALRFSGGNQQKIVLSRWLKHGELEDTRVLLLDEPTQGVDVGARGELYDAVRKFADGGRGVVFVSSEADEMVQVADRVVVLARGRVVGSLQGADITERKLMELAHFGESEDIGSAGLEAAPEWEDSRV